MLSLVFLMLASICNAIMDVCNHKYGRSIFYSTSNRDWNRWWNTAYSWRNKYIDDDSDNGRRKLWNTNINYPVQLTDAWHFFKMLMIIFITLSIVSYNGFIYDIVEFRVIEIIVYGTIWNTTFSLFYKRVFQY